MLKGSINEGISTFTLISYKAIKHTLAINLTITYEKL